MRHKNSIQFVIFRRAFNFLLAPWPVMPTLIPSFSLLLIMIPINVFVLLYFIVKYSYLNILYSKCSLEYSKADNACHGSFSFLSLLVTQVYIAFEPKQTDLMNLSIICIIRELTICILKKKSHKKVLNKRGPNIESCGTPKVISSQMPVQSSPH